jgi:peptidoglycan/xylan/chitin deacetylase (PgdA/CDA1 family)/acyl carrier protein
VPVVRAGSGVAGGERHVAHRLENGSGMKNVMSVDVEDWFCVYNLSERIPYETWDARESRVERATLRLLDIFGAHGVEATFFVLGWVAERFPDLVREIEGRGHEVASHGYAHRLLTFMRPDEFREDLLRSLEVRAASGLRHRGRQPDPVRADRRAHRAPHGRGRSAGTADSLLRRRLFSPLSVPNDPLADATVQCRGAARHVLPASVGDRPRAATGHGTAVVEAISALQQPRGGGGAAGTPPVRFLVHLREYDDRGILTETHRMNADKLHQCFSRALGLPLERVTDDLAYNTIKEWDSVGHMALVVELETDFDVMFDTDDILGMSSVGKAREILTRLGASFDAA